MSRILVGFDGSPPSHRAVTHALARAKLAKGEIVFLNVLPQNATRSGLAGLMPAGIELPPQMGGTFHDRASERLEALVRATREAGIEAKGIIRLGEPAAEILAAAREMSVDEIVIGVKSYEKGGSLGPNASRIILSAPVPITVVP